MVDVATITDDCRECGHIHDTRTGECGLESGECDCEELFPHHFASKKCGAIRWSGMVCGGIANFSSVEDAYKCIDCGTLS